MKQTTFTIAQNSPLAEGIYRLHLQGDTTAITAPGQFVNLKLEGFYLRRPISVCDWADGELTLLYKVLGRGTEAMTRAVSPKTRRPTRRTSPSPFPNALRTRYGAAIRM